MLENIKVMMIGWFYYGILFMAGSVVVTSLLNRVFTKLYIPPLIVNAVSVLLLVIGFRLGLLIWGMQCILTICRLCLQVPCIIL